jgi:SP family sugar:H+ symporter-like MFS transporter
MASPDLRAWSFKDGRLCSILHGLLQLQIWTAFPENHWYQVMVGRWVAGLGVGARSLLVSMYQGMASFLRFFTSVVHRSAHPSSSSPSVYSWLACINFGTYEHQRRSPISWRVPIGIGFIWIAILGSGIMLFPETLGYAYRRGRKEEAKSNLDEGLWCTSESLQRAYGT